MSIVTTIRDAYLRLDEHKWKKLYWCIDLHGTIIKHSKNKNINEVPMMYPHAEHVLSLLSNHSNACLILYTSSYRSNLEHVFKYFKERNILFKYLNENPECTNGEYTDFSKKFYYDILLDDKAGFNPNFDWLDIQSSINIV